MSRKRGAAFASLWLLFLLFPLGGLLDGHHAGAFVAGSLVAVAGFAGLYLWTWFRALYSSRAAGLLALAGLTVFAFLLTLVNAQAWVYTFIYVVVTCGFAFRWRPALYVVVGYAVGVVALLALLGSSLESVLTFGLLLLLLGLAMIGSRRTIETTQELGAAREEVARLAVTEERLRFARDLHDLLGHSLSVIVLKAELATRLAHTDSARAAAEMADVEAVARQALREVREAVAGYRQSSLSAELTSVRQVLDAAGIEPRIEQTSGPLPAAVESILAWAVREGVTNVVRHSRARHCTISLTRDAGEARLEIDDDGVGPPAGERDGSGLRGLRERVQALAGSLDVGRAPAGGGFRLAVRLPVPKAARPEAVNA